MPIRREFRPLYPLNWSELSRWVRFERAGGRCQDCGRPHLVHVRCLPDGARSTRPHGRGATGAAVPLLARPDRRRAYPPDRVVLAAAHLDSNPAHNRLANLRGLCQRCHMLHDRPFTWPSAS